ncbi:MAG: collagen binding domain-containing protein [Planctomycetota bacterium]
MRTLWILAVFACALVAALVIALRPQRAATIRVDASASARDEVVTEAPLVAQLDAPAAAPDRDETRAPSSPSAAPQPGGSARGSIRGELTPHEGALLPRAWTLSVRPSTIVTGAEVAEVRRIAFENGEADFRIDDLPLGGYSVRALAPGLNSVPVEVLLVKGSSNPFVTLALAPSGTISGMVFESGGEPARGVTVTLESRETKERRMIDTDATGAFQYFDVLDGEYTLFVGRPEAPLVPPRSLVFHAPRMTLPAVTLGETGSARVTVRDDAGRTVAGAVVTGFASPEGVVDVKSDERGVALAQHLPPGRYRLFARLDDGRRGTAILTVVAGQEAQIDVRLRE